MSLSIIKVTKECLITTPDMLDDAKELCLEKFGAPMDYFTIRNGKARYHMIHLPDKSVGIYYALRMFEDGSLGAKRVLEPEDEIVIFPEKK